MIQANSLCQLIGRATIDGRVRVRKLLDDARAVVHWEAFPEGPVWIEALDQLAEMPLCRLASCTNIQGLVRVRKILYKSRRAIVYWEAGPYGPVWTVELAQLQEAYSAADRV